MASGSGSLNSYMTRALSLETLVKLLTFQLPVVTLASKLFLKLGAKLAAKLGGFTGNLTRSGQLRGLVRARFLGFEKRRVQVGLVYADGDTGVDELGKYCGKRGAWLSRFKNVSLRWVANTDHNMTADHAQDALFEEIEKLIQRIELVNHV